MTPTDDEIAARRKAWFTSLVTERIMPMLDRAAEVAKRHGMAASTRIIEAEHRLEAELTLIIPGLPPRARPPRLIIYLATDDPPLMVEYTGTFPGIGATGGFGAEIDYVQAHVNELEEKIVDFLDMAAGGGTKLTEFPR